MDVSLDLATQATAKALNLLGIKAVRELGSKHFAAAGALVVREGKTD